MPFVKRGRQFRKLDRFFILALYAVLCFGLNSVQAQVVIVPSRSQKPVKAKTRPKPPIRKTAVSAALGRSEKAPAAAKPAAPAGEPLRGIASSLGFAIVKPPMENVAAGNKPAVETPPPAVSNVEPEKSDEKIPEPPNGVAAVAPGANQASEEKPSEPAPKPDDKPQAQPAGDNKMAKKPVTTSKEKPADRLFSYQFEVIASDARGRITESGREQRRYLSENLPGGVALEMVEVPGGSFLMGSSELEANRKGYARDLGKQLRERVLDRLPAESPQHVVKVAKFYFGKFEVTQSQWNAVASLPKVKRELMSDPSQFKGGNRPVEKISWEEAVEFCERLSRATGRKYRLPTEAEWEYACRAGVDAPFHFGQSITTDWANFDGERRFLSSPDGANRQETVPAGSLGIANRFGLYDMHGNVWEWCLDGWHENYQSAPDNGGLWQDGAVTYLKVVRGGGWDSAGVECRSGFRDRLTSTLRMNNLGFRVVAEIEEGASNIRRSERNSE